MKANVAQERPPLFRSPRRIFLATLGILCVGLAGIGVVVPGMPTTIFLIAASYLFTKSCPVLEEKLIRNRFFGPFLKYLDGDVAMPAHIQRRVLIMMWGCVGLSTALLICREAAAWLLLLPSALAAIGHWFIVARNRRAQARS